MFDESNLQPYFDYAKHFKVFLLFFLFYKVIFTFEL